MLRFILFLLHADCYTVTMMNQFDFGSGVILHNKTTTVAENLLWKISTNSDNLEIKIELTAPCNGSYLELYHSTSGTVFLELCGNRSHRIGVPSNTVMVLFHSNLISNFELKWTSLVVKTPGDPCTLGTHTCSDVQMCRATSVSGFNCTCRDIIFTGFANGTFEEKRIYVINNANECQPLDAGAKKPYPYRLVFEYLNAKLGELLYPDDKWAFERQIEIIRDLTLMNKMWRRVSELKRSFYAVTKRKSVLIHHEYLKVNTFNKNTV